MIAPLTLAALLLAATPAVAGDNYGPARFVPRGGVQGGDALVLPNGDILNVRNIQGGTVTDPNLDLGAGSSTRRGTITLNYDVGHAVKIYDGHKHLLARFDQRGVRFYRGKP